MNWVLEWDDKRWTSADLTVGHVILLALCNGNQSFDNLDPRTGTTRLVSMLAAFVTSDRRASGDDTTVEAVLAELSAVPFLRLVGAISTED